ncbi:hypothetical protein IJ425_08735 [bacterium]|nr:hypothetical protein [bacterium]
MATRKRDSYDSIAAEIERLVKKQEELKEEKLNVILNEIQKAFKTKNFQESVLRTEDAVLKEIVRSFIENFNDLKSDAESKNA